MQIYKTLIIGGGFSSIGYAAACPGTVICEEHQICDTGFYLPLRSFRYQPYAPKTEEGAHLLRIFHALSLFKGAEQNTNGFEFALSRYVLEKRLDIQLKCRVIDRRKGPDAIYDVTVQTNRGLEHLLTERILDTTPSLGERFFTVLFVCNDIKSVKSRLLAAFDGAYIEPAFYPRRYALHLPVGTTDENRIKHTVYEQWRTLDVDAKILYMAPVFYTEAATALLSDAAYANPIQAFEAGYFLGKENHQ